MKSLFLGLILISLSAPGLLAQTISGDSLGAGRLEGSAPSPTPAPEAKKAETAPQGPTIIDSETMDYDEKTRVAVFTGEDYGVHVQDPSFVVYCDKLTAHMRRAAAPAIPGAPGAKTPPAASPSPKGKADAASHASGLQSALAEGGPDRPVVIVQDKPASNGDAAQHNVGIALKADYNADTGDVILTGWPRVSQGINTQIATSPDTVMTMNKDGKTMTTRGPSRTVIQEQNQPKTSGTNAASTDSSPSPTAP
jgi:lipopolysaccharide export system protein LptA